MKRFSILFFCYSLCFCVAQADELLPADMAVLASKSLLLDIVKVENSRLVAVGEHGNILLSSDGKSWQQAKVPIQSTLTGVYFLDNAKGWAVGHDASILNTVDGGFTWQIQQYLPQLEKPLFDVAFKDKLNGIAVGAYGQFYRSVDGGITWQVEFHEEFLNADDALYLAELKTQDEEAYLDERASILPHFNRLIMDGRTLYMVGESGLIAKSNDFGMGWQLFPSVYGGSFFDLARTQQGNLVVVGLRGNVYRSMKNGTPWTNVPTENTALLNAIVLSDDDRIFVLGNNGVLLESVDDGQHFALHEQSDGKALIAGVWFNQQLVAVSDVGIKVITVK